jgi:hypothetical protein
MKSRIRKMNDAKNASMTMCHKGGIKIHNAGNEYKSNPFGDINPFLENTNSSESNPIVYDNVSYNNLDLNIEHYSRNELFGLFGLKTMNLTENIMKDCKKVVLKTHPDKSKLEPKYFLFFSSAYKKLYSIYEFQNKTSKKSNDNNEYHNTDNEILLDTIFEKNKTLKEPKNFNNWFNSQFEKHKLEDSTESGYGNWLKSDEDIVYIPNVNKTNMASEMEKRKKQVQQLTTYEGYSEQNASTFGGSSLMEYNSNFTSGSLFSNEGIGYTDLRQAYVESVIPVTEDDYNKTTKFKSLDEYKRHRENVNITPLSKEEATNKLFHQNKQKDEESAALAFYYAQQTEKVKQNQENFWSGLKQLKNSL